MVLGEPPTYYFSSPIELWCTANIAQPEYSPSLVCMHYIKDRQAMVKIDWDPTFGYRVDGSWDTSNISDPKNRRPRSR